ncbi:MAG: type II toxin-antitoxin system PemK/MazF family toxin [Pseudomonadota bacterium]|nr:type II toxin-antitoxin system PemK/MazF family toxin [Pseudomonadota bacterium]
MQATYDIFDVVRVPFPFSDLSHHKRRPALVISSHAAFGQGSRHAVVAMITGAHHSSFPLDVLLTQPEQAGLPKTSTLRMKLFTIEQSLIEKKLGRLRPKDRQNAAASLRALIPLLKKG